MLMAFGIPRFSEPSVKLLLGALHAKAKSEQIVSDPKMSGIHYVMP
jgi:hypothetical protein